MGRVWCSTRAIGFVSTLALIALVYVFTSRLVSGRRWLWGGLAAALLALNPHFARSLSASLRTCHLGFIDGCALGRERPLEPPARNCKHR